MTTNFKEIFEYKASKIETDKAKILSVINTELSKFNFEDDYLKEGGLEIILCNEVKFHTCTLENFTDTRSISETNRPNKYGVQVGSKRISEFNSWDYKLSYNKEFQNSDDNHSIEESHHAIGCGTCKQHGKIRCSNCRGAGDITCSRCSGRGEKQCSSCSGRGETECWSCSGKGTKETGYGDNKRIERCSSCSGRGYKPCSSCRNGYVTCSSCIGRGRVTCYTCHGSGEVTCYQCDGYRTMDHYFIVNAKFINFHQRLFVTNPFPGFDNSRANEVDFTIQNKLFEFKESRFNDGYFEQLQSHPLYRQICAFFDFKDSDKTKLISSRITFFENRYFEVSFAFYGETYTIYLDQNLSKSYYGGKKPSDQYELDLLNKSLKSASNNELDIAKKTIQKLSKYDFISINEKYIVAAIDDTQNIYEAKNEIDNRNYSYAESTLRLVSDEKKNESDFERLIKRLNRIYFTNTTIVGLISFAAIYFKLIDKDSQFTLWNILISIGILIICWLVNRATRSIHWSRWLVLLLFGMQFFAIIYYESKEGDKIRSEKALQASFDFFKSSHYTVFNGQDSIILIEPTGQERRNYYLPKGKPYIFDIGGGQKTRERIAESKMYLNIEQQSFENARGSYKVTVALKDNNSMFRFDIEANYDDIRFDNDDNDIEIRYMRNSIDEFKLNNISTIFISNSSWQAIKGGAKSIEATKSRENQDSAPSADEINPTIQVGAQFQGGIIVQLDETGEHGLIMSTEDLGDGNWTHAVELCDNYSNENYDDWRLPTLEELRIIYVNKNLVSNFQENWYWSSTEDPDNLEQAYHLGFISGDEMTVPKEHGKFVRAVRNF
jgi:hypothetical protein